MSALTRIRKYIFGNDVFISYARNDGSMYAASLANTLVKNKITCYIDQWGTNPGKDLPIALVRKLKLCNTLIILGTHEAIDSDYVEQEIDIFLSNQEGHIIPIDFQAIEKAKWFEKVKGIARSNEALHRLDNGAPSEQVIDRILNAINYSSQYRRLRRLAFGTTLFVLILVVAGMFITKWQSNTISELDDLRKKRELEIEEQSSKISEKNISIANLNTELQQQEENIRENEQLINIKENELKALSKEINELEINLKHATIDTYIEDVKKNFFETPSFAKLYELINHDRKNFDRLGDQTFKEKKFKVRTRMLILIYRNNLQAFDQILKDSIQNNPSLVDEHFFDDLVTLINFFPEYIPSYFEEIVRLKIQEKLPNLNDKVFFSAFTDELKHKYSLPYIGGTLDLKEFPRHKSYSESFKDSILGNEFREYIFSKAETFIIDHDPFYIYKSSVLDALNFVLPCQFVYLIGSEFLPYRSSRDAKMYYDSSYYDKIRSSSFNYQLQSPIELTSNKWESWLKENQSLQLASTNCR